MRDIFWRILATVVLAVYIMATKIEFVAGAFPWLEGHSKLLFEPNIAVNLLLE